MPSVEAVREATDEPSAAEPSGALEESVLAPVVEVVREAVEGPSVARRSGALEEPLPAPTMEEASRAAVGGDLFCFSCVGVDADLRRWPRRVYNSRAGCDRCRKRPAVLLGRRSSEDAQGDGATPAPGAVPSDLASGAGSHGGALDLGGAAALPVPESDDAL